MFLFTWQGYFQVSDVGINVVLAFLANFILLLVTVFGAQQLQEFVSQLPRCVVSARAYLGGNRDDFSKYVSCQKCHSVYNLENSTILQLDKSIVSTKCNFIRFPQHPKQVHRQPCGTFLMKTVRTSAGSTLSKCFAIKVL